MSEILSGLISEASRYDPDNPDNQWKACIELGSHFDPVHGDKIIDALINALESKNALARAHAAEELGNFGASKAIPKLREALCDPYRLVRSYAAKSLGKLKDKSATNDLLPLLQDDFFGARAEAFKALGKLWESDNSEQGLKIRKLIEEAKTQEEKNKEQAKQKEESELRQRVLREANIAIETIKLKLKETERELEKAKQVATEMMEKAKKEGDKDKESALRILLEKITTASITVAAATHQLGIWHSGGGIFG
jgi:hypothetical protein